MIVGAVEIRKDGAGRIRIQKIPQVSSVELIRFIRKHIAPGATIITHSCQAYRSLRSLGYRHIVRKGETTKEAAKRLPHIHRIFTDLKTWLIGTHHGVSPKQLQTYLDEFSFRFNERRSPMEAFQTALRINPKVTQTAALETVHET
jgi:transposase-like protein